MDVTKKYSIAYKGLKNGRHDFTFQVGKELFEAFENSEIRDGGGHAAVALVRSESMLELSIAIDGYAVVVCDRCLEECRIPIEYEGSQLVKFSEEIRDYDGEVMWLSPAESEIDLSQYIYESIVLSLPYRRVHPEGECDPEMLERFRIVSDEEFATIEAQAQAERAAEARAEGAWTEKLAGLKERLEQSEDTAPDNKEE